MRASVTYSVKRGTLRIRIKLPQIPAGVYDTGIQVPKEQFDKSKQICGLPEVQLYMYKASRFIRESSRPGLEPQDIWTLFVQSETSKKVHTLNMAFDYYLMENVIARSTRKSVLDTMARLRKQGLLDVDMREITPAIIVRFIKSMTVSEATAHKSFRWIRSVVNKYIRDHQLTIKLDLGHAVKAPKKSKIVRKGEEPFLTLEEVKHVMELSLTEKLGYARDMFCLMAFTGMAIQDMSNFVPEWIDEDGWLTYARKKTGNACEIPVIAQAKTIIAKYTWPMRISMRTLHHHCATISQAIGKNITPHTARRSFGCIALELGFSMEAVSKMMGHSSIRTTESIYAKVTRDKIKREMRELPAGMKLLMNQPLVP